MSEEQQWLEDKLSVIRNYLKSQFPSYVLTDVEDLGPSSPNLDGFIVLLLSSLERLFRCIVYSGTSKQSASVH